MNKVTVEMNDGARVRTGAVSPKDAFNVLMAGGIVRMGGMV